MFIQQQYFGLFQGSHEQCQCLPLTAGKKPHLGTQAVFQPQIQCFQKFLVFFPFFGTDTPA